MIGFIYFLKNPITNEAFYVGATRTSLNSRLRTHYQHLREFERGLRGWNKRYQYLADLRPLKAEIHLIEIVTDIAQLDEIESHYIKLYRGWNFSLTNQTDGGKGGDVYRSATEMQRARTKQRLQAKLKGVAKPEGFAKNMSEARKGTNNPMSGTSKYLPVVCFDDVPVMFKHPFEVNNFVSSRHAHMNIIRMVTGKSKQYHAYGYKWKFLHDCDQQIQDIVQSAYESSRLSGDTIVVSGELIT